MFWRKMIWKSSSRISHLSMLKIRKKNKWPNIYFDQRMSPYNYNHIIITTTTIIRHAYTVCSSPYCNCGATCTILNISNTNHVYFYVLTTHQQHKHLLTNSTSNGNHEWSSHHLLALRGNDKWEWIGVLVSASIHKRKSRRQKTREYKDKNEGKQQKIERENANTWILWSWEHVEDHHVML